MAYMLVSDKPVEDWASFLAEGIQELSRYKVRGVAMVALLEPGPDGENEVMTGYHNMNLRDKQEAASHIQADVTDGIVRANMRRYLEELENEEDS